MFAIWPGSTLCLFQQAGVLKPIWVLEEVLYLFDRSSNPVNGIVLINPVRAIDSDYYNNSGNEGPITGQFVKH